MKQRKAREKHKFEGCVECVYNRAQPAKLKYEEVGGWRFEMWVAERFIDFSEWLAQKHFNVADREEDR